MRLQAALVKIGCGVSLLASLCLPAQAAIEDTLSYYDSDDYGNVVYFGSSQKNKYEFIFVDGSKTVGAFASSSIAGISSSNQAGYAVTPANTFEEMSRNAQFAKIYTVDCDRQRVTDEDGDVLRLSNASAFHQTAAGMACSVLE